MAVTVSEALARPEAREAPDSGIVEVFNYGRGRPGIIPLWAGEGDLPTPTFIVDAANRALAAGETFYTAQRGLPELRQELARWHEAAYGRPFDAERFFVTGSGMQAIQIAVRLVAGPGDEVLVPAPAWPNIAAALGISGAGTVTVPMHLGNAGWQLDLDRLFAAATPRCRAIFINSPANPTGWTASAEEIAAILAFARRRGLWLIVDEVYQRFYYRGPRAPSFHDIAAPDDPILFVNTFSKNWAMTGWRIGWLAAPVALGRIVENLIQYSTSGVAAFMQRASIAALREGETFIREQVSRATAGREIVASALGRIGGLRVQPPDGAFYLFFGVDRASDTRSLALRLVDEANVGLAPGTAFGEAGKGFLRLCFLRSAPVLEEAMRRLAPALTSVGTG
ncbi:MAG: pyridoxal phosphate-dependent aminotransferase [Bauldia sp.]